MIAIIAARLFDGAEFLSDRAVLVDGERITAVAPPDAIPAGTETIALPPTHLLAPGFVDIQVNGGGGVLFNDAPDETTLRRIAAAHARHGTTAILPTLISGTRVQLGAALEAARAAIAHGAPGIAGLHLEGPFIAPARRGIHPAAAIRAMAEDDLAMLCAPFPAPLLLTVAPEVVPPALIRRLVAAGRIVFAGHTDADYATATAALAAGARGFTHLYNAMSGFVPRAPGTVGAALDHASAYAGLIADGHHSHDAAIRLAFHAKGPEKLALVSDAMATAGADLTGFVLNGEPIHLSDGRLVNDAGTLAGAHLTLADAIRHAVKDAGLPLAAALQMATSTPATAVGLAGHGRIAPGFLANLVALDPTLTITAAWQHGTALAL